MDYNHNNPMEKETVAHFIKYNNAVPIVLGILFLSTSATLAASPVVRDSVYSAQTQVVSTDNTYIISASLDSYPFAMRITSITEDDSYYYLTYDFDTIDIVDGVWQDVMRTQELRISKELLGEGDFEAYVESELAQVRSHELAKLKETQAYEKRIGMSEKIVATAYAGLIGKFFEPTAEHVPQYISEIDKDNPLYIKNPIPLVT